LDRLKGKRVIINYDFLNLISILKSYFVMTMKNPKKNRQEKKLFEIIKDGYGTPAQLAEILDLGVVMLFYLEEDTFSRREVQSVVEALRGIGGWLRE
jgi:hypothetical protein